MGYVLPRVCGFLLGALAGLFTLQYAFPALQHWVKNNIAVQKQTLTLLHRMAHPLAAMSFTVAFWLHTAPAPKRRSASAGGKRALHVATFVGFGAVLKPALAMAAAAAVAMAAAFFFCRARAAGRLAAEAEAEAGGARNDAPYDGGAEPLPSGAKSGARQKED
jgi:hypothetical protein